MSAVDEFALSLIYLVGGIVGCLASTPLSIIKNKWLRIPADVFRVVIIGAVFLLLTHFLSKGEITFSAVLVYCVGAFIAVAAVRVVFSREPKKQNDKKR